MRKLVFLPILALAFACADTPTNPTPLADNAVVTPGVLAASAAANPVVQRITGSGHYTSPPVSTSPGARRVFTMNALKMADGTVKGNFTRVLHVPGEAADKASGTITCFTVIDNVAWIGGHLDGEDPPDVVWQVVDNGQGRQADPDEVGLQFGPFLFPTLFGAGFAEDFCNDTPVALDFGPPYNVLPLSFLRTVVEDGNIQIK